MKFITIIIIVVNISICLANDSLFRLEREGKAVEKNVKPLTNETTDSRISCFIECLNHGDCCFIQIKEVVDRWLCALFPRLTNIKKTVEESNSAIFSIIENSKYWKCSGKNYECMDLYEQGLKNDGVYDIVVNGQVTKVFCDMTKEGGGWTVIQRRMDGSVDFNRTWNEYKEGFGNVNGEYWLGNDLIHQMTESKQQQQHHLMRIKATTFQDVTKYIIFGGFWIEGEEMKYKLHAGFPVVANDNLGDDWTYQDKRFFTTKDRDHDGRSDGNCATIYSGGFWFASCFGMNPNNIYSTTEDVVHGHGITWRNLNTHSKSLKSISMAIKSQFIATILLTSETYADETYADGTYSQLSIG